jgi:DNA mismatch endonuclease (patch repair protein)
MVDRFTKGDRSLLMSRIRGRDTKPELIVRSALHRAGFRFRLHKRELPGRPDIVFPKWKVAVFVNGCFWHGHDCPRAELPKTNVTFWTKKIANNLLRDQASVNKLRDYGWCVVTIWTCSLNADLSALTEMLRTLRSQASIELTK